MNKNKTIARIIAFALSGAVLTGMFFNNSLQTLWKYNSSVSAAEELQQTDGTTEFVERLYSVVLGRKPDSVGLEKWVNQLKNGKKTAAEVVYGFVFSPEYTSRKETNDEYIKMLYATLFDREPDPAGFESWQEKIKIFSRKYILRGFIQSSEFSNLCENYGVLRGNITLTENRDLNTQITSFTANLYITMLGRYPDSVGLNNWTGIILNQKKSLNEVILDFMGSSEFTSKNLENADYVSSLYKGILGRNPDSAGLSGWVEQLEKGKSRFSVFIGMVKSDEFRKYCAKYDMDKYIADLSHISAAVKLKGTYSVYNDASYSSGVIGTVYSNQILNVTGIKGEWLKVSFHNKSGYIHSDKVSSYDGTGIKVLSVTNIPQNSYIGGAPLPTGCEVTSLAVLMNYLGFTDAGKNNLADNYMPKGTIGYTDPNYAFVGSPSSSASYGAYANTIVRTAENYFSASGAEDCIVKNITGADVNALLEQVSNGNPVLVWYTMNCTSTRTYGATWHLNRGTAYTQPGTGSYSFTWKNNEHCSVLVGYNKNKGTVILADVWANSGASTGGLTEYSLSAFESAYNWLGKQAVIIEN